HEEAKTASDVDTLLRCGCVTIRPAQPEPIQYRYEYHEAAVRPCVLHDFITAFPRLVSDNKFADMQFRDFAMSYKGRDCGTLSAPGNPWTYFYRRCDHAYPCASRVFIGTVPEDFVPNWHLDRPVQFEEYAIHIAHAVDCPAMRMTGEAMLRAFIGRALSYPDELRALVILLAKHTSQEGLAHAHKTLLAQIKK